METEASFDRILILGGMGSGKTTLARRIAASNGAPLHHLDDVAYPEETGRLAPADVLLDAAGRIAASPRWVAEGIHLGWTDPLLEAADVIVWLDHVRWRHASSRVLRRFAGQAIGEARRQRGLRKFLRFRDYARRLRELAAAISDIRRFEEGVDGTRSAREGATGVSRAATATRLDPYRHKLIQCRTPTEVEQAVRRLVARA